MYNNINPVYPHHSPPSLTQLLSHSKIFWFHLGTISGCFVAVISPPPRVPCQLQPLTRHRFFVGSNKSINFLIGHFSHTYSLLYQSLQFSSVFNCRVIRKEYICVLNCLNHPSLMFLLVHNNGERRKLGILKVEFGGYILLMLSYSKPNTFN